MPNRIIKLNNVKRNPITFLALGNSLSYQDRNGSGSLTASGAVRYAPGPGGRINYANNPSFESGGTGWTLNAAVGTFSTEWAMFGNSSQKLVSTGISTSIQARVVKRAGTYTASVYAKNASSGPRTLVARGQGVDDAGIVVQPGAVVRHSITRTWGEGNQAAFIFKWTDSVAGDIFYFDGYLLEQSATVGDYFDGSAPGCAWVSSDETGLAATAGSSTAISISKAAFWVEEATTNLLRNPSAEVDVTTGIQFSGGVTGTRDTTYAYVGSASVKVVTPATIGTGVVFNTASGLGYTGTVKTFIGSVYLRGSGSVNVNVTINYTDLTSTGGSTTLYALTDAWTRVVTPTVATDSAKTVDFIQVAVRVSSATITTYWCDSAQLEEKSYATSYCDGSLGTGYTWAGTAHASASSRAAASVSLTALGSRFSTYSGAMVGVFTRSYVASNIRNVALAGSIASGEEAISLRFAGASFNAVTFKGGIDQTTVSLTPIPVVGTWTSAYAGWDMNHLEATLNGGAISNGVRTNATGIATTSSNLSIGHFSGGQLNGFVGPIAIFDRPLTQAELTTLQATDPVNWWNALA